ncbi:MAG: hypothetical protein A3A73_00910 [Omnitrophica bacterium RIFCSPLOWO2_01_FULL_50_24]|nr:MAG: hypothetical protein A3A73_00910 [Omnitrophica bacterium RIFCSPLOWO2_01_FULL_50_24]
MIRSKIFTSQNRTWLILLFLTALGFFLRFYHLAYISIAGDEWFTLANAKSPGRSYYSLLYFGLVTISIHLSGISTFALRAPSALFGTLALPLMFLVGRAVKSTFAGLVATFLLAVSTFHIAHSQQARMYSLFCLLSLASILLFIQVAKRPQRKNVLGWIVITILNLLTHFNALFLLAGQLALLMWEDYRKTDARQKTKWLLAFGFLCVSAVVAAISLRERVFITILGLSDPVVMFKTGVEGFSLKSVVRVPFAIYMFIFGPNMSPFQFWFTLPVGLLSLFLFLRGLYQERAALFGKLFLFLFAIPFALLFYIAEPLSIPNFAHLGPKYVIFALPLWSLGIALGVESASRRWKAVVVSFLTFASVVLLIEYYHPAFSYYAVNDVHYQKASDLLQKHKLENILFVVDGRASEPFNFYNQGALVDQAQVTPDDFIVMPEEQLASYSAVAVSAADWTAYHSVWTINAKDRLDTNVQMLQILQRDWELLDGYVDYPFFFYLFGRGQPSDRNRNEIPIPVEFYDFRYADIDLPIVVGDHALRGSFHLDAEHNSWSSALVSGFLNESVLSIYWNLEASGALRLGERLGQITIHDSNGNILSVPIVNGENVLDVFPGLYREDVKTLTRARVAKSWLKQPLISTSVRYPGSFYPVRGFIYETSVKLGSLTPPIRIEVNYQAGFGTLRVWGLFVDEHSDVTSSPELPRS